MKNRANFYGIRGRCGYVHARCFQPFREQNATRDAQDRIVSAPEIDSVINDLDDAASGKCLHCGLTLGTISDNERKALALSYNETRLRRRLEEARETLVDRKLFGFGRFDFGGNRLIGDNGLVLQWQTRPEPDQPESHRNSQNGKGYVFLLCPAKPA